MTNGTELLLRNIGKYAALEPDEAAAVAAAFVPVRFRKRDYVLREGEISDRSTFVTQGCLRLYHRNEDAQAHVLQFAVEDWWITDLQSYIQQVPSRLFIDALEDTQALQITRNKMEALLLEVPRLERAFRILGQKGLASLQQRIVDNLSKSAMERYLSFRQQYGALEGRLPQHQIAAYIGVTPEFLSALRRKLARGAAAD